MCVCLNFTTKSCRHKIFKNRQTPVVLKCSAANSLLKHPYLIITFTQTKNAPAAELLINQAGQRGACAGWPTAAKFSCEGGRLPSKLFRIKRKSPATG